MVARTPSLRGTVVYLMHMTYWLQKKCGREGIPTTSPLFLEWQANAMAPVPTIPKVITDCMVLPTEAFVNFVMNAEYRASLNREFPKGGLMIVQGLDTYRKFRLKNMNKTLRELVEDPESDCVQKLKAKMKAKEMIPLEIFSYPERMCALICSQRCAQ